MMEKYDVVQVTSPTRAPFFAIVTKTPREESVSVSVIDVDTLEFRIVQRAWCTRTENVVAIGPKGSGVQKR